MTAAIATLTGPPGSGKTTAGRLAAAALGFEFFSSGGLFREEAERRGVDVPTLSRLAERDPSIDRALDDRMIGLATPGRFLEGRIIGALLRRRGTPVAYLVVTADAATRVARIQGREGGELAEVSTAIREREASEADRFHRYYGIDLAREPADLVVDSSHLGADAVAERLATFVRGRLQAAP